jgi:hypothetical protein
MIIDKEIKVKISKKNILHFGSFFKDINLGDIITIDVETHLQKQSNKKINVSCDLCSTQRYINYQAYTKNISSSLEHPFYTCDKCSHIKIKEFNKKKYGVEYYSQHPERNEKVKKTSIEKYGVEHYSKSHLFIEKVSKTNLDKFGFVNPFMDNDRIKKSFKEKYGVEHPSHVLEFKNKMEDTNLERYGFKHALQSKEIQDKIHNTNIERYGGHPMKNNDIRYLNQIISRDKDYISYKENNISIFKCNEGHHFEITSELYHNRLRSNIPLCVICYPINDNSSIKEKEILKYIESIYSGDIIENYKNKYEIDIYIPDLKIGFEFNGLYWHSEEYRDSHYHLNKTKYFNDIHIRIIHIWEDDWDNKRDIVKSMILNQIKSISNRIFARKCEVREIYDINIVRNFLEKNHIQGYVNSVVKIGLFYNNELVSLMTFDRSEGRKKMKDNEWNLSRFCNKINTSVIGGASKILSFFKNRFNPVRIISYADKDWSMGTLYSKLNFSKVSESKPDYKYIINKKRIHKSKFRKSNLDTNLSESKYMKENNIPRIWDCGKIKFELKIP